MDWEFVQLMFLAGIAFSYIGYSKNHYRSIIWGILSGLCFFGVGIAIGAGVRFAGAGSVAYVFYTATSQWGRIIPASIFCFGGVLILISTVVKWSTGGWEEQNPLADWMNKERIINAEDEI